MSDGENPQHPTHTCEVNRCPLGPHRELPVELAQRPRHRKRVEEGIDRLDVIWHKRGICHRIQVDGDELRRHHSRPPCRPRRIGI
jgi:hypothetical protein